MKIPFSGRILLLGSGAVSRCLQPLLLRHLDMDFSRLTIMDFVDCSHNIHQTLDAGAQFVQERITQENFASILSDYLSSGDLLIDLAWNLGTPDLITWCHDNNVLYINTSIEEWDPYQDMAYSKPTERTLYARHMELRDLVKKWQPKGPTAVVEHGANPGLVSHWTKQALQDISQHMLKQPQRYDKIMIADLEKALGNNNFAVLAQCTGTKVLHIAERDSQITNQPKQVNEFVNTWSIEGFREEGISPAEMGWGTHERTVPAYAQQHTQGPKNQICLAQMGINTMVRSWVPSGEIIGMVVRHGEAFSISDHLTVWNGSQVVYRPTVHYAYLPCDGAFNSLHELKMHNYELQKQQRIMNDEIIDGKDELGVLLLGHELNGWWTGSLLDIHETRKLVPGQNATTLQVAASLLGALCWMIKNPTQGYCVPDDLPYKDVLRVAGPYLGPQISVQTDWNPLKSRFDPFSSFDGKKAITQEDMWQFGTFLV